MENERQEAVNAAKREFARYGFVACPLTDDQIKRCLDTGVAPYGVGCDVASGFSFREALAANAA